MFIALWCPNVCAHEKTGLSRKFYKTSWFQITKLQPFLDKLLFISSDYFFWLLHNLIFCNMGVANLKLIYWLWRSLSTFQSVRLIPSFLVGTLQPFMDNFFLFQVVISIGCFTIPFFVTWVSKTWNRFIYFGGFYLGFSPCDLNLTFSWAHTYPSVWITRDMNFWCGIT